MKDREFRVKVSRPVFKASWEACARLYGKKNSSILSDDGDEAFDAFVAGYRAGLRAGKRKAKK